jgi:glycosyltransferase involved in cell wall biosynthesis
VNYSQKAYNKEKARILLLLIQLLTHFCKCLFFCNRSIFKTKNCTFKAAKMIKNRDIIVVSLQPLDLAIGSNCINIANEFAKYNRVLYVNYPLDSATLKKERDKKHIQLRIKKLADKDLGLVKIGPNFYNLFPCTTIFSINWIPFTFIFNLFNFINNYKFAKAIRKAIKKLNFQNYIIFNDSDMFRSFYLKELLKPSCYVYYSRDNLLSVAYWKKHGIYIEPKLMRKSDVVCANSVYLAKIAAKYNKHAYDVGQGCDITSFDSSKVTHIPEDIATLQKPIIGYIGALYALRLDINIIEHIAQSFKNYSIVLIGPEDEHFKKSKLHKMDNVYFLGLKDGSELPSYLNQFDVAINPQALNETTIGNYPRKIDEYLAMGKPTVATYTEAMSIFKDHVYLAKNKEEYITYINNALTENNKDLEEKRKAFARTHTWENSVNKIYNAIISASKK